MLLMDAKESESDLLSLTGITRSRFSGYDLSLYFQAPRFAMISHCPANVG